MVGSISFDNGVTLFSNVLRYAGGVYFLSGRYCWCLVLFWWVARVVAAGYSDFRFS